MRLTTCSDLEPGLSDVKCVVQQRHKFMHNLISSDNYPRSYLEFVVNKAIQTSCEMGLKFLKYMLLPPVGHNYESD